MSMFTCEHAHILDAYIFEYFGCSHFDVHIFLKFMWLQILFRRSDVYLRIFISVLRKS